MFPIGCATGCFQGVVEAEADVDCLLAAVSCVEELRRPFVAGYVAVATLALTDALRPIAGKTFRVTDRESFEALRRANKAFKVACDERGIEQRLRDHVRNRASAHRKQQSLESHHETHLALTDPAFPDLITAARRLLWTMQTVPVWFLGSHRGNGLHVMRCRAPSPMTLDSAPCGFEAPKLPNRASPTALSEEDIAEEFQFMRLTEASERANHFWGMQPEELDCCGRKAEDRSGNERQSQG